MLYNLWDIINQIMAGDKNWMLWCLQAQFKNKKSNFQMCNAFSTFMLISKYIAEKLSFFLNFKASVLQLLHEYHDGT